jgi:DNA-binding HxlR family transcriptional regulator
MLPDDDLRELIESRWFIPVLAFASREDGARSAVLAARLRISRSMLASVLEALLKKGWMMRNPGHGHPLRPDYVLTEAGRPVGAWCERVTAERERLGLEPSHLGRWSLPLVRGLDRRWQRFSSLQAGQSPLAVALAEAADVRRSRRAPPGGRVPAGPALWPYRPRPTPCPRDAISARFQQLD